jgi:uncharacterized lipoprotein YmbA
MRFGCRAAWVHLLLAGMVLALLAGCGSPPITHYYDIQPSPDPAGSAKDRTGADCLHLLEVRVPEHLDGPRIFYRSSHYEAGRYEYHRWIRPLSDAIAGEFLKYLRAKNRFASLAGPLDPRRPGAVEASLVVDECNEVDLVAEGASQWIARISMRMILEDPDSASRREVAFQEEIPVSERNASGVVTAINEGLARIFPQAYEQIEEFVRSRTGTGNIPGS